MKKLILILLCLPLFANAQDTCKVATTILIPDSVGAVNCVDGSTTNHVLNPQNICYYSGELRQSWYKIPTSKKPLKITVKALGLKKPNVSLYSGLDCDNRQFLGCDTALSDTGTAVVYVPDRIPSLPVYISVQSQLGELGNGDFRICVERRASTVENSGPTCSKAVPILSTDTIFYTSIHSTADQDWEPACFKNGPQRGMWFKFSAKQSGFLEWLAKPNGINDKYHAEFDWAFYDITDGCPSDTDSASMSLQELACNWNFGGPGNSDHVGQSFLCPPHNDSILHECPQNDITSQRCFELCKPTMVEGGRIYGIFLANFDRNNIGFWIKINTEGVIGVREHTPEQLKLYPNPVEDYISLDAEEVHVFDLTGKILLSNINRDQVNVSSLPPGLYILQALKDQQLRTAKFFKK